MPSIAHLPADGLFDLSFVMVCPLISKPNPIKMEEIRQAQKTSIKNLIKSSGKIQSIAPL